MKRILPFIFVISMVSSYELIAQSSACFGFGVGIDYGGIGIQVSYLPVPKVAFFGGLGFNLNSAGYNVGAQLRFPNKKKVSPYLTAMYGYNAVLITEGSGGINDTYYGATFGGGIQLKFGRGRSSKNSFLMLGLLIPIRPQAFYDDIDTLKNSGYEVSEPLPIGLTIGYHLKIGGQNRR